MKVKDVVVGGVASGLVIFVVWMLCSILVMSLQLYDVMTLGGMRARDDPVMLLFFLHPWVIGFALAVVYSQLGGALKGSAVDKGVKFGLAMWAVYSIPTNFVIYTSMNYPLSFSIASLAGSLVYMIAAGIVLAKLSKA